MHISLIDIIISIALKSVKFHWFRFREYPCITLAQDLNVTNPHASLHAQVAR